MVVDADNRPLDQFLAVRDHALGIVQSEVFENQLEKEWFEANLQPDVRAGLIAEMGAVPRAFEVSQATGSAAEQKGWRKHLLEVSSTVVESVKDFFSNSNNGYVKSALTLLKESVDIYKGW